MNIIVLLIILLIVFGGAGYGWRSGYYGNAQFGGGLGLIIVVVLILWLLGII